MSIFIGGFRDMDWDVGDSDESIDHDEYLAYVFTLSRFLEGHDVISVGAIPSGVFY